MGYEIKSTSFFISALKKEMEKEKGGGKERTEKNLNILDLKHLNWCVLAT